MGRASSERANRYRSIAVELMATARILSCAEARIDLLRIANAYQAMAAQLELGTTELTVIPDDSPDIPLRPADAPVGSTLKLAVNQSPKP